MTLKELQTAIGYPNGDALRQLWNGMYKPEPCPGPHDEIHSDKLIPMLKRIAVPYRNRPEQYSNAAQRLLQEIQDAEAKNGLRKAQEAPVQESALTAPPATLPLVQEPAHVDQAGLPFNLSNIFDYPAANIVGVASTAYGLYLVAGMVGLVAAFLYAVVIKKAVDASSNANSYRERSLAVWMVIALEVFAGFVHFFWSNAYFWENKKILPWQGTDTFATIPGSAAMTLAILISGIGIYSIVQVINRAKDEAERIEIAESVARMEAAKRS